MKKGYSEKPSTKSDINKFIEHATRALEVKINDEKGAIRLVIVCPTWYSYFREPRQATTFNSFTPSPWNTDPIAAPLALLPTVEPNVAFSIDVLAIVAHKRLAYTRMWTHMDCTRELWHSIYNTPH